MWGSLGKRLKMDLTSHLEITVLHPSLADFSFSNFSSHFAPSSIGTQTLISVP